MKIIKYFFQAFFVYLFFLIGIILRLRLSRKFFSFLFKIVGPIFKSKITIEKNLLIFDKNISEIRKKEISSKMWASYGKTFIEYVFLNNFRNSNSHMKYEGENILESFYKNKKQAIFISGHFSNFELMSMEITKKKVPLATIYRPLNNYFINPMMEYLRRKYVCKNQIKKGINGVRETIEFIKKGYSVALMIDQRVSEGDKINFFGKPALTTTLPAQLALKFKIPIIPVFIERDNKSNFKIKFYDEIKANDFKNKDELSMKLNKILESMISNNPNEWIWSHNRWK